MSSEIMVLKKWFSSYRRHLPWRGNPTPYEVWVAEVMLQQTRVNVVVPYFQRWMKKFPTIYALSEASTDQVIKAWEGLGYYSRARNLYRGACYVVKRYGGVIPSSYDALKEIKGLGSYTVGAILSFAFKKRAVAVDSNVLRVMARYYAFEEEIDKRQSRKMIEEFTRAFLPEHEPWVVMEALIELGALICQKKAYCSLCPLHRGCRAYNECKVEALPKKKPRAKVIHLHRTVSIIHSGREILVKRGERGKVMQDLWEFPSFDLTINPGKTLGLSLCLLRELPKVTHAFTRYKAFLYPKLFQTQRKMIKGLYWILDTKLSSLPFSSGHRQILCHLKSCNYF